MQKTYYTGISNASGALALDSQHFIVADDEDNLLRIYAKDAPEKPLQTIALKEVFKGDIVDGEDLEIDLEGAAVIDNVYFWIGSHSASRKGKFRPARHRLLAMHIKADGNRQFSASRCGSIYTQLIADLEQDKRYSPYKLSKAQSISPKDIGGLSIEGLANTPDQGLLIGFRNPLAGGKVKNDQLIHGEALLVPLLNPLAVIAGEHAKFGDPIELDLDGYGIRDIVLRNKDQYLIVAGPYHGNDNNDNQKPEKTKLYSWSGNAEKPQALNKIDLSDLNIEAAFFYPDQDDFVQLLSDDGKSDRGNGFRSLWVKL